MLLPSNADTGVEVEYKQVTTVNGNSMVGNSQTTAYAEKPTVFVPVSTLSFEKKWKDADESKRPASVTVDVKRAPSKQADDESAYKPYGSPVTITEGENGTWKASIYVPVIPEGQPSMTYWAQEQHVEGYNTAYENNAKREFGSGNAPQGRTINIYNYASKLVVNGSDIKVRKTVTGISQSDEDFTFTLTPQTASANNNNAAIDWGGAQQQLEASVTDPFNASNGMTQTGTFDGSFTVPADATETRTYVFDATEVNDQKSGWRYDDDTVKMTVTVAPKLEGSNNEFKGEFTTAVAYDYARDDTDATTDKVAAFTNQFASPVSALPLTGGSTGRVWLVAGGVFGVPSRRVLPRREGPGTGIKDLRIVEVGLSGVGDVLLPPRLQKTVIN